MQKKQEKKGGGKVNYSSLKAGACEVC